MKSRAKIPVAAFVLFACLSTLAGIASSWNPAPKYQIRWLITHQTLDYFNSAALSFKKEVESGSRGAIKVQIEKAQFYGEKSEARAAKEIAQQVAGGQAQMGHTFTNNLGQIDHRLWAFDLPYLIKNYGHQEAIFEGDIGPELLEGLREQGLVGLTFTYSGGAQGVVTRDREIRSPKDLKGLKVGVFGNEVDKAWLSALGAVPVPIEHDVAGILPMTRDGAIDAAVVTWRRLHEGRLHEEYKFVNMMNATHLTSVSYINADFYASLPEKYRALIKAAAEKAGRIERANTIALNERSMREMTAKGMRAVHLSEEGRRAFERALAPAYAETLSPLVGKGLIARIKKASAEHAYPLGSDEENEDELQISLVRPETTAALPRD